MSVLKRKTRGVIASTSPAHVNRYENMTEEERDAFRAKVKRFHDKYQSETLANAESHGNAWTKEEDDYMLSTNDTIEQMARHLGRTFYAVKARLARIEIMLTLNGEISYRESGTRDYMGLFDAKRTRILCACAADVGEDHQDWCPDA